MPDAHDSTFNDAEDLGGLTRWLMRRVALRTHTAIPGKVLRVRDDAPTKPVTVDVQPSFRLVRDDATGNELSEPRAPLYGVVAGIHNSGGFRAGVLPRIGDTGWVLVSEIALERWYSAAGEPVDPGHAARHSHGGLWLPCGSPGPTAPQPTQDFEISTVDGQTAVTLSPTGAVTVRGATTVTVVASTEVVLDAPIVRVGGPSAAQTIPTTEALVAAIDAMLNGGVPIPQDGGVGLLTTMKAAWAGVKSTIGSVRGKVQ